MLRRDRNWRGRGAWRRVRQGAAWGWALCAVDRRDFGRRRGWLSGVGPHRIARGRPVLCLRIGAIPLGQSLGSNTPSGHKNEAETGYDDEQPPTCLHHQSITESERRCIAERATRLGLYRSLEGRQTVPMEGSFVLQTPRPQPLHEIFKKLASNFFALPVSRANFPGVPQPGWRQETGMKRQIWVAAALLANPKKEAEE